MCIRYVKSRQYDIPITTPVTVNNTIKPATDPAMMATSFPVLDTHGAKTHENNS